MVIKQPTEEQLEEFLRESNAIEREYSQEALEDSNQAWIMGVLNFKEDFSIDFICGLHRRIMKRLNPKIAGNIRDIQVYVGNSKEYRECLKPQFIREELIRLIDTWKKEKELYKNESDEKKEELIKSWHVSFERIHPFQDGNGRTGRIIMNLQRLSIGLPILIIHEGEEQFDYYKWFKNGNGKSKDRGVYSE